MYNFEKAGRENIQHKIQFLSKSILLQLLLYNYI